MFVVPGPLPRRPHPAECYRLNGATAQSSSGCLSDSGRAEHTGNTITIPLQLAY